MLKKIYIYFLITAVMLACTPTYNVSDIKLNTALLDRYNSLSIEDKFLRFEQGGFEFAWRIMNQSTNDIYIDMAEFECVNSQNENAISKVAFVPGRTPSQFSDDAYYIDKTVGTVVAVLGVILIIGVLAAIFSDDDQDDAPVQEHQSHQYANHESHRHHYDHSSVEVNIINSAAVTVVDSYGDQGRSMTVNDDYGRVDDSVYFVDDSKTLKSGVSGVFRIRCPIIPYVGESNLVVKAKLGDEMVKRNYQVLRKDIQSEEWDEI
ncbi:MAG: hypothetical protein OEZ43_04435 [Gammaproteobacteria bacterium]|nr:hypothetical protein [Gammaproteobacteria bacterium]